MDAQIRNIIFDLGGVLLDLDVESCLSAFEAAGAKDIRRLITGTNELDFFKDYECGTLSTSGFREAIRRHIGKPLADEVIDRLWNSELRDIPQEKLQLIEELSHKYRLFLLSNTNELHWRHVAPRVFLHHGKDLTTCFEHIFLSYKMHLAKPNPEIFRTALREAGIRPEETLFIDDAPANCMAAETAGIRARHYTPGTDLRLLFR